MSLWEPAGCVEYSSGLEIEPKKQERQLLCKVGIIKSKIILSTQFTLITLIVVYLL